MEIHAPVCHPYGSLRLLSLQWLVGLIILLSASSIHAQNFQAAYDLAKTPGPEDAPDIQAYGNRADDGFGRVLRTSDMNGDGIDDLIVGAPNADVGDPERAEAGAVYVWLGKGNLAGTMDAGAANDNAPDLTIFGASANDQLTLGGTIAVGDVDGDGITDLILGAGSADGAEGARTDSGEAYVVLGRGTFPATLDLAVQGDGGADVTIYGAGVNDQLTAGGSIAVGDMNGDGIADLILGAVLADGPEETRVDAGEVCIVLGRVSFPVTLDLAVSGHSGADVTIYGSTATDTLTSGGALAAGDLNGDGIADLLLGAVGGDGPEETRNFAGEAYVVFGRVSFPASIDLAIQGNGGANATLYGATGGDQLSSGGALAIQDLNGDGIADILLGAIGGDGPGESRDGAGEAYIIFGHNNAVSFPTVLDLGVLGAGGADCTVYGATAKDNLTSGGALAVGDVDGDGLGDLLLGSPLADGPAEQRSAAGEAYIFLGRALFPVIADLDPTTASAHADVTIYGSGASDNLTIGGALLAGDVNGDGIADILLGARDADGADEGRSAAGEAYVILGRSTFPALMEMTNQGNGDADVALYGATAGDQLTSGGALAVGDLNGDGLADLILGAGTADGPDEGRNGVGEAYVLFGVGSAVAGPEITVEQPLGANLSDSGSRSFGAVMLGANSSSKTFTIKNIGTENLTGLSLSKDGAHKDNFNVDASSMSAVLTPGSSTTFSISFTPSVLGLHNAAVHVTNNDSNENPYDINLSGTGTTPEISVEQPAGEELAAGGSRAFGAVPLGGSQTSLTFTIRNSGSADLTNFAFTKSGAHHDDYTVSNLVTASVAGGSSTAFTITFTPGGLGIREAVLHLTSNDTDESPFDIVLTGSGIEPTPEIAIQKGPGSEVLSGSSQSFGALALGAESSLTLTLKNTGTADLSELRLLKDGLHADDYTITNLTKTTLTPGMSTTFVVTFAPRSLGLREASLQISSNDADENPFHLSFTGTGTNPELVVEQPTDTDLANGEARDLGIVHLGQSSSSLTFTIKNTGTTDLTSLDLTKDGIHAGDYIIGPIDTATVQPGGSVSFTVAFRPLAVGIREATLHLSSNDADENPFNVSLRGSCIAPEITVEAPIGTVLADGVSEVKFGGVVIESSGAAKTFTIRNTGTAPLTGLMITKTGTSSDDFGLGNLSSNSLAAGASMAVTATFSPTVEGIKTAVFHIASNDADEPSFDIILSGMAYAKEPLFVNEAQNPLSRIVLLGSKVVLAPFITGSDPKTHQWSKDQKKISTPAGKLSSYTIASAKAGDAAIYSQTVINAFGNAISPPAYLGIAKRAPVTVSLNAGTVLTLTCTVTLPAGVTPFYEWRRDNEVIDPNDPIDPEGHLNGVDTKTLKIAGIRPDEAGVYTCRIIMDTSGGPVHGTHGDTTVTVVEKPTIPAFSLAPAYVGESIHFTIPRSKSPSSFSVTGLPPGIVLDKINGILSGKPTTPKVKGGKELPYQLKVSAKNSAGTSDVILLDWMIRAMNPIAIGTFDGLVARNGTFNKGMGGSIRVVTTPTGSFTGKIVLGAFNYPLKDSLTTPPGGGNPSGLVNIARKDPLTDLEITWTIDLDTGKLTGWVNDTAGVTAWRTPFNSTRKAEDYAGNYTAGLLPQARLSENPAVTPQGDGFVSLSVAATGIAKWTGRLADGTAVTGSATVGPQGQVPFIAMLYGNLGSAQGWSVLDKANGDLDSAEDWDWFKNAQPSSRSYPGGIELHTLTLIGGRYSKPQAQHPVLGLPSSASNAKLVLSKTEEAANFSQTFTITQANAVQMPANGHVVKVSLASATGLFSGGFTLIRPDVFSTKPNAIIKQAGTFNGVLVPRLGRGTGHLLLPEMPRAAGESIKKTPIISGHVSLEAASASP